MRRSIWFAATFAVFAAALAPALPQREHPTRAALVAPAACGAALTTGSFSGTTGPLGTAPIPGVRIATANVSGVGAYLWDVNLHTVIQHASTRDLDITLTSPLGTAVAISTNNGGITGSGHSFNGTSWDDAVTDSVADASFPQFVAKTPLAPEGRLAAFRGEDPNGTWTLTIRDELQNNAGTLVSWSLAISTLPAPPIETTTTFQRTPGVPIGPHVGGIIDELPVAGLGTWLLDVDVTVEVPHEDNSHVVLLLASPLSPTLKLTTDNGGTIDNGYNGTLFDVDVLTPVTDAVFVNLVATTPVSPEGGFEPWLGQDPNGTWQLIVADDSSGAGGTLVGWSLAITTIPAPAPSAYTSFAGTTGPIPDVDPAGTGTFVFTCDVAGMPTSVWDVDLTTQIAHTRSSDVRMTLRSPAGTTAVITTSNGDVHDNVFNGTLWDDNVNDPVTDHVFTNLVVATPLSPEGRLATFRGENPNGTWTLTIVDMNVLEFGALSAWSLQLATLPAAPPTATTVYSRSPNVAIPASFPLPSSVSDTIAATGLNLSIAEIEVYLEVPYSHLPALDITLTSPAGTVVTLTTDNGGVGQNSLNGTLFDADALPPVTDAVWVPNVAQAAVSPEGSFDNFVGQDPNGNWTLRVWVDSDFSSGTFRRWDLTIRTCANPPPVPYCFGDGSGTPCPCSPAPVPHGGPGKGCPTNVFANGALAAASGVASLSADTLLLTATDVINGTMLFYQGATQQSGGAGAHFGDGLRCIQPTGTRRFKSKIVVGNTSSYPGAGDAPISVAGMVGAPSVLHYQGWYRSANPTFCTSATFNFTNALSVTWVP